MTDLAAVVPLLLVAGVFVAVCIAALRATDWKPREDRTAWPHAAERRDRDEPATDVGDDDQLS